MKAKLERKDLESPSLSWLCIQPMLLEVRGKDLQTKREMYNLLSDGQKGLYLFYSFHNHTRTLEEFYWFAGYNLTELKAWKGIRDGVLHFGAAPLAALMDEIEKSILSHSTSDRQVQVTELEKDEALKQKISELYERYKSESGHAIQRMNQRILTELDGYAELQ